MIKKTILMMVTFLLVSACQKDITIDLAGNDYQGKLFIECLLIPGQKPRAYLSNSMPFFSEDITPQEVFARDAQVFIATEDNTTDQLLADSIFDKFRCRWVPFYQGIYDIELGKTYELKIIYEGQEYEASTSIHQAKVDIDTVGYVAEFFDVYGGHDGVNVSFKDNPGSGNFYRFQMDRWIDESRKHAHILEVVSNECTTPNEKFHVSDYGRTVFTDEDVDGQQLTPDIEVSFEYLKGDTAIIYMMSLDQNAAKFYQDIDNQLTAILNPFVEPVFLDSKIGEAIGFFGSAVYSDPWVFVYPEDNP